MGRVHDSNIGPRGGFLRAMSGVRLEITTRALIVDELRRLSTWSERHRPLFSAGHGPRSGTAVQRRLTVTVNLAVALLALSSVAEQTTLVRPSLKRVPE